MIVWKDEFGGVYTADKKKMLRAPNVKRYKIAEGCEEVAKDAFEGCEIMEGLYVPESFSEEMAEETFHMMPSTVICYCQWDRPYVDEVYDVNELWYDEDKTEMDELGVVYANDGKRLIEAAKPGLIGRDYYVPDGVLTICDGAFRFCDQVDLSVPRSIKVIGDYIFGERSGKIVIRD
jgi:hypothetical protein